jgi:quinol monooxygenase YgiN
MLIVSGTISVDPERRDEFLAQVLPITVAGRSEPGCLEHLMSPDPLEPGDVLIFERWASAEDLERHLAAPRPARDALSVPVLAHELFKYEVTASEALVT